jgi:hypothetical protein
VAELLSTYHGHKSIEKSILTWALLYTWRCIRGLNKCDQAQWLDQL